MAQDPLAQLGGGHVSSGLNQVRLYYGSFCWATLQLRSMYSLLPSNTFQQWNRFLAVLVKTGGRQVFTVDMVSW